MKKELLTFAAALALTHTAMAGNTITEVEQVAEAVTLTDDVDYVITGNEPFTTTGSIDITNTEHAVVILENIRPSKAIAYLGYIKINGEDAVNEENCQVKMYASGAIIMPYGKDFKPLTVYSEPNFGGDSSNDFGLENANGYMNTLTTAKLNNRIRSFKLKRGYMVTFSNSPGGRGYSRCFIADKEDLEFASMPKEMDQRISSYRVFKWYNYEKKGIASDASAEIVDSLNVTWCYDWGQGNAERLPDCEWVPHHIYEDWPSVATCGSVTQSPHMQTNNEPGNSADDTPQSVETVLNNWENLMATGMRLCSPSSHDGSLNWMYAFMDSIDARGWRCDILDMHCYWPEWNLNNQLQGWYDRYKRPIWVSEFVWGASWNNNGIFATDRTFSIENQQKNYDVMSKVLTNWNSWPYIERYAYWNSEADCSKLYNYDLKELSILGRFYANMKSGMGYNKAYEYVPKVVQKSPTNFRVSYDEKSREVDIRWSNPNLEFTDSAKLEMRLNDGEWQTVQVYPCSEKTDYTYLSTFPEDFEPGVYTYRVHNYDIDGQERLTREVQISLVAAQGQPGFQYGTLNVKDMVEFDTRFDAVGEEQPAVLMGLISYNNPNAVPVNMVSTVSDDKFSYCAFPWNYGDYERNITTDESTDFMVLSKGTRQIGDITLQVGESSSRITNDSTWISFETPFPEGVTPVVVTTIVSRYKAYPYMAKVWNITREGFAIRLVRQAAVVTSSFAGQNIYYVAATPGTATMEDGKVLTVGRNLSDAVDGRRARLVPLTDEEGNAVSLYNPFMLIGSQTDNYEAASVYRLSAYETDDSQVNAQGATAVTGVRVIRQKDNTNTGAPLDYANQNGDFLGWVAVSDGEEGGSSIGAIRNNSFKAYAIDGRIVVEGGNGNYSVYSIGGQQVPVTARLARGLYIVKSGAQSAKVLVP